MAKMRFASKNRSDGSVYHFPISENQKRPEKEITFYTLPRSGYISEEDIEAKKIAHEVLDDFLKRIKDNRDDFLYWFQVVLRKMGISLSDDVIEAIRENMHYSKEEYDEMAKLVRKHLDKGESEYEIQTYGPDSDIRNLKDILTNRAALRTLDTIYIYGPLKRYIRR